MNIRDVPLEDLYAEIERREPELQARRLQTELIEIKNLNINGFTVDKMVAKFAKPYADSPEFHIIYYAIGPDGEEYDAYYGNTQPWWPHITADHDSYPSFSHDDDPYSVIDWFYPPELKCEIMENCHETSLSEEEIIERFKACGYINVWRMPDDCDCSWEPEEGTKLDLS